MIGVLGVLFTGFSLLAAAKPPAGGVIAGKVYRLKNKGSGKYLNLCGGSDTTGKNINQFKDDGTDTLKWRFIEGAGDYVNAFKIQPILSSTRVVDVQRKGQPIASGGNIQLYSATDDISQHFVFKDTGDGDKSVYICPYTNQNVYMTANGDSNGTHGGTSETAAGNVFVKSSTGTNYQKWFVEETQANPKDIAAGTYYIRNYKSNLYMGITSGYNVEQQNFTGASTQQWVVSYDTNGYYTLKIKSNTNYRLDVDNAWDENGTNVKAMTYTGYDAQLFRIIPSGTNLYRISPKHSTLRVVDVNGGYTTAGANIHLWNYVNAAQQRWIFEEIGTNVSHSGTIYIGTSSDNYDSRCDFGGRVSNQCADAFVERICATMYSGYNARSALFRRKDSTASKEDFMSKKFNNGITKANIDDVDVMLFVGHGRPTYGLHFSYGPQNTKHSTDPTAHDSYYLNFRRSEARFGYQAKTKWFIAFTCNFLNASQSDIEQMFYGIHAVLGYSTSAYLVTTQMSELGHNMKLAERPIIDVYLDSGHYHTNYSDNPGTLTAAYVDKARGDTIYRYASNVGVHGIEQVCLLKKTYKRN